MAKVVNAAVVCNSLSQVDSHKSGMLLYTIEASAIGIGYSEYRDQDIKLGATREINNVYSNTGKRMKSTTTSSSGNMDFMPIAAVQNETYSDGVEKAFKGSAIKEQSTKILKAMGLSLKNLTNTMVGTTSVPAIGTPEWLPYRRAHIASGGSISTEDTLRESMARGLGEKARGMKDVSNMSVGYFGRIDSTQSVAPVAMYYTILEMIDKSGNSFSINNANLKASYTMAGFEHNDRSGSISSIPGKKPKVGTGKVTYHNGDVTIKVQVGVNKYKELILKQFAQQTTVSKDGQSKTVDSSKPSKDEQKATDFDMDKYYQERTFIPLTKTAMKKVGLFKRATLLMESKASVTQVMNVQDTPWYASTWFKIVVFVVTMVINYFIPGAGQGLQFLINMAVQLAIGYAIHTIVQMLVKAGIITNAWVAMALEVGAMLVAGYFGLSTYKLDFTNPTTVGKLMEATGQAIKYQGIIDSNEYKDTQKELQEEQKRLDEQEVDQEDLHTPSGVARLQRRLSRMLDDIDIPILETPEQFRTRTTRLILETEPLTYNALKSQLALA